MLDLKYIREHKDEIKKMIDLRQKTGTVDVDELLRLDDQKIKVNEELTSIRQKRNELDDKTKTTKDQSERQKYIEENTKLKPKAQELDEKFKDLNEKVRELLWKVPNIVHPDVPIGKDEDENVVVKTVNKIPKFDFPIRDHMELGKLHNIIETEKSSVISGSRFNYLFGEAATLQMAIVLYTFHTLSNREIIAKLAKEVGNPFDTPFTPVIPPVIAKADIMKKMDRFDPIDDRYYYENDDVLFIGSAEHTLGPLHMNEIIDEEKLPIRYIGYSTAFRREAGAYGKDTAGILRRHQFDKLEMETFIAPKYGLVEQNLIVAIQEYLVGSLELPYQVMHICTGDAGKPDFRQIDINTFMPGQNKYRETHTSDYMTDYQARRLNIKYRLKDSKDGAKELVHMNDATAFALGRILIAIIENNQQKDGSIVIPKVLQKYTGFDVIKSKK